MSRILIIDDDASLRSILRSVLEKSGHTVFEASGGREGLVLWRRQQTDVVITDLYMPETDGIEVIHELRKCCSPPKIICMSGGGKSEVFGWGKVALSLGANSVLHKPFDRPSFLAAIAAALANMHYVAHVSPSAS